MATPIAREKAHKLLNLNQAVIVGISNIGGKPHARIRLREFALAHTYPLQDVEWPMIQAALSAGHYR
jgi:hypothetical protein